jgi:hypothetical protein
MGMGGLGVWRAAKLWLTAPVAKLATPRDALSVFLLQICGYTSQSRAAVLELRNLVCLMLAQVPPRRHR